MCDDGRVRDKEPGSKKPLCKRSGGIPLVREEGRWQGEVPVYSGELLYHDLVEIDMRGHVRLMCS